MNYPKRFMEAIVFVATSMAAIGIVAAIAIATAGEGHDSLTALKVEEGFSGLPYEDTRGFLTFGYGTKLPITKAEGAWLLEKRLADTHDRLAAAWKPYGGLDPARQSALLDMAYELGVEGLLGFHDMLAALERGGWTAAGTAAMSSVWAREVPDRAKRIAAIFPTPQMRDG